MLNDKWLNIKRNKEFVVIIFIPLFFFGANGG